MSTYHFYSGTEVGWEYVIGPSLSQRCKIVIKKRLKNYFDILIHSQKWARLTCFKEENDKLIKKLS